MDTVVSHLMHAASVYNLNTIMSFIFHGAIVGGRQSEVVSRLELHERLARLKTGLPARHLGSDHFALGAEFRITDRVAGLEWSGTPNSICLPADGQPLVEVEARNKKRYFQSVAFLDRSKGVEEQRGVSEELDQVAHNRSCNSSFLIND